MSYKWRPSKTAKINFAEKMDEISDFCRENHIIQSFKGDSYYFRIKNIEYRVSNHTIDKSIYYDNNNQACYYHKYDENTVYITASKTRIIEIYNDLKNGYELDERGKRKNKNL